MADWRDRAEILTDVVYFNYAKDREQKNVDEVFIWDLDKTYLDTQWGSVSELVRTAIEKAFQKKNVPGTATLIRALKNSSAEFAKDKYFPIYFVTASPPFLEERIKEKLLLDGICPFGTFFKDNLKNLHYKRLWRLKHQVGYKLQALLQLRVKLSDNVRQVMWGDDSESDTTIYSLYSDICARRLSLSEVRNILSDLKVTGEQLDIITDLQSEIPEHDPVEKVYINLATDTDPEYYLKFGRRVVATKSTFQVSLDLFQDGRLSSEQVVKIGCDMRMNYGFSKDQLQLDFDDLIRRKIIGKKVYEQLKPDLAKGGLIYEDFEPSVLPAEINQELENRVYQLEGVTEPWIPDRIDYLHDYR